MCYLLLLVVPQSRAALENMEAFKKAWVTQVILQSCKNRERIGNGQEADSKRKAIGLQTDSKWKASGQQMESKRIANRLKKGRKRTNKRIFPTKNLLYVLFLPFFYPFAIRLLSISYLFFDPSFSYPFSVFNLGYSIIPSCLDSETKKPFLLQRLCRGIALGWPNFFGMIEIILKS